MYCNCVITRYHPPQSFSHIQFYEGIRMAISVAPTTTRRRMSQCQTGKMFARWRPLAHRIAGQFANRYDRPHYEMVDAAESILSETLCMWDDPGHRGYDPNAGTSRATWIYRQITWRMSEHMNRGRDRAISMSALESQHTDNDRPTDHHAAEHRTPWIEKLIREIGDDARVVLETILFAPDEIAEELFPFAPSKLVNAVWRYYMDRGWSPDRLAIAWKEIEVAI